MIVLFSEVQVGQEFFDTFSGEHCVKTGDNTARLITGGDAVQGEDEFDPEEYVEVDFCAN
jgi:hypothetical protein